MAGITVKDVYDELINQGASTIQAIGIIANGMNEDSSFDPEVSAMDSNGYVSYGLWQFNAASYPNAAGLVTGDPKTDLRQQVSFLKQNGGFGDASGSTIAEAAGNFAANFERCQGCNPGGSQYNSRVSNASTVQGWVDSGKWPQSGGSGGGGGTQGGTQKAMTMSWWTDILGGVQGSLVLPGGLMSGKLPGQNSPNPLSNLADISSSFYAFTQNVNQLLHWVSWIFSPSNWLRIGAFFFGLICFIAAGFMFKEAI